MRWKQQLYIDTCLPFGLRSAPKLFNVLADLLSWILEQQGVSPIMHYLDDFLTLALPTQRPVNGTWTSSSQFVSILEFRWPWKKLKVHPHHLPFWALS